MKKKSPAPARRTTTTAAPIIMKSLFMPFLAGTSLPTSASVAIESPQETVLRPDDSGRTST